jgi:AcrR family transcriptional regulator
MPEKLISSEKQTESTRKKHKAILMAAREIFVRQGYEDTTIAEIAAAAGVAVGTIYLYFRNKRDIYIEASLLNAQETAAVLTNPEILALPFKEIPRAMIEAVFKINRLEIAFSSLLQVDVQNPKELEAKRQSKQLITESLDRFLRLSISHENLRPFDTEMYANLIFDMVNSAIYDCFCLEQGKNEERYREATIELIERLIFGPTLSTPQGSLNQDE